MGELYRSGQITPQQLDDYTAKYGVKTVVNLRGDSQGSSWYEAEIAESRSFTSITSTFVFPPARN